jgi:hypothetical protein
MKKEGLSLKTLPGFGSPPLGAPKAIGFELLDAVGPLTVN